MHHLEIKNDVLTETAGYKAIQVEQSQKMASLSTKNVDIKKVDDDKKSNEELVIHNGKYTVIDNGKYTITVSSVGTLDIKGFIETAMSLPSFRRGL